MARHPPDTGLAGTWLPHDAYEDSFNFWEHWDCSALRYAVEDL